MIYCPWCGQENDDSYENCLKCRRDLIKAKTGEKKDFNCLKCSRPVFSNWAFCPKCKEKLEIKKEEGEETQKPSEPIEVSESLKTMKFDWKNWNIGGKIVFVAACISILSMFMKWVDVGIASQTGLSQQAFLFLGLYIYPVLILFKNKPINRFWGLICAIGAVLCALSYISSKSIELFGTTVNAASTGAYLFLLASVGLVVGIVRYSPPLIAENKAEQNAGADAQ